MRANYAHHRIGAIYRILNNIDGQHYVHNFQKQNSNRISVTSVLKHNLTKLLISYMYGIVGLCLLLLLLLLLFYFVILLLICIAQILYK